MAIRVRKVNDKTIALCAAKTKPKKQDIYLDDNAHHALNRKFYADFIREGLIPVVDRSFVAAWIQTFRYNYDVLCGVKRGTPIFDNEYILISMLQAAGVKVKDNG